MFQNIISAILSFGIWNRVTKEQNEKTNKSSWLRVIVYGVLSFLTGVFLYQSYQVSHIRNFIYIEGIRGTIDSESVVGDSVQIQINNVFRHPVSQEEKDSLIKLFFTKFESDKYPFSGLMLSMLFKNDSTKPVRYFPNEKVPKDSNLAKNGHLYRIDYFSSSVPSFFPVNYVDSTGYKFELDKESKIRYDYSRYENLYYTYNDKTVKKTIREKMGRLGSHDISYVGDFNLDSVQRGTIPYTCLFADTEINTLNFFSAADISKCIYTIYVASDCPLKYFGVNFDIPVDIKIFDYPADSIIYTGFNTTNPEKLNEIRNHSSYTFFVNFPTLENMQLIRSLILTSLVTIFVTLFCSNVYFCFRRLYKKKHRMPISEARKYDLKKAKLYKVIMFLLYLILLGAIAYLGIHLLNEDYFIVRFNNRYYLYAGFVLFIIILCIFIYYIKKKLLIKM